MNSVDFRSVSNHKRRGAVKHTLCFFPLQSYRFFNLILKAHRDLNLLLRLPCGMAWSDGCCSIIISSGLWSSCPCWVRSVFHKPLCSAARLAPSLPALISPSPFQAPHLVGLTQWLVGSHPKWAWGTNLGYNSLFPSSPPNFYALFFFFFFKLDSSPYWFYSLAMQRAMLAELKTNSMGLGAGK